LGPLESRFRGNTICIECPQCEFGKHHYFFWLLALDAEPDLPPGLSMWGLLDTVEPHVIGMNRLMGTYSRS